MTEASGADAAQWYERAYTEDSSDIQIALGYGKSLIAQGQVGAAIFVLEPLAKAEGAPQEIIESYVKALLSASRFSDAEPLVWQLFLKNPSRLQEVADLIGLLVDAQQDAEAVALARKLEQFQRNRGERRAFVAMMQDVVGKHQKFARISGVHERVVQCLQPGRRLLPDSAQAFRSALRHGKLRQSRGVS